MTDYGPIDKLVRIGLSKYEARAYLALLKRNPVTGEGLADLSGIPRSMINQVADKLASRGALVTLPGVAATEYAPVPAERFLDRLHREHADLVTSLKDDLMAYTPAPDDGCVWNISGGANIMARAQDIIAQSRGQIYLAASPATVLALKPELEEAARRTVRVVVYTTARVDLPEVRVVITPVDEEAVDKARGLGLILIRDSREVLIGEWLAGAQARASWTYSPLIVSIAEHHLVRGGRRRFLVLDNIHRTNEDGYPTPGQRLAT